MELFSLSKDVRIPSYHYFRAQRIYYITIVVCSYEHGAEKILSLSNIHQMSVIQQRELFIQMYIRLKSMLTTSCTTASVERVVYQDRGVINILEKSVRRRTIELQLL